MEKNKMASMPVPKLLISTGAPIVVSMMLQALYNIVDSAFVARMDMGESALNALTLAFPVQMFMVAIGIGTGVGVNVLLSRSLGENNIEKASRVSGNAVTLGLIITAVFMLFGFFGVDFYISTQTQNAQIASFASVYLKICCISSFGIVFFSIFEKLLQATGYSLFSTISQISGAVLNIVLDPIMIFGLFGFPKMGVAGAALATVLGQIFSFVVALFFHIKYNKAVKNKLCYFKLDKQIVKEIYIIGFPAIVAQALMSVMTYGVNVILVKTSESLVTAYGLYYKIQQFVLFAAFGLRDAITPIVSFGYGMQNKKRITDGIKYGVLYTTVIMLVGTLALEIFASVLCHSFKLSPITENMCIQATRIISLSFVFAGANVALQGAFQALGSGLSSLAVSVCRQILFVLPTAYLLNCHVSKDLSNSYIVWLSFIIAECATFALSLLLLAKNYKGKIKCIGKP